MHHDAADPRHTGGPLAGLRVLDISSVLMGPYATQMLGDMGAEVIVVEPFEGSNSRRMGAGPHAELSGIALNLLRNKHSVAIDLKTEAGRAACLRIAATCDVVVTNLRSTSLGRLGLRYADVSTVRPDIVFCQAVGFASSSPRADDAAFDDVIQAACGLADAQMRSTGEPRYTPTVVADKVCALAIVNAVLAAIIHRGVTGAGQSIELPMLDVMTSFMLVEHGAGAIGIDDAEGSPDGRAGYARVLSPGRRPFRTSDGWIGMLPYSARDYDRLFTAGGREDLVGDARTRGMHHVDHADFLYTVVAEITPTRSTGEWMSFCREADIAASAVATLDEIAAGLPVAHHEVAGAYRFIPPPVQFSASPSTSRRPASLIGQDTEQVLTSIGCSATEVEAMEAAGAVVCQRVGLPTHPVPATG